MYNSESRYCDLLLVKFHAFYRIYSLAGAIYSFYVWVVYSGFYIHVCMQTNSK